MSHKEIWNMVTRSREIWPQGEFLHELDLFAYVSLGLFVALVYILIMDWRHQRWARRQESEYDRWQSEWQNNQNEE